MSHVVYKINWLVEDCELPKLYYIGQVKRKIQSVEWQIISKMVQNMKDHIRNIHRNVLTRSEIVENPSCIKKFDNVNKQKLYEAYLEKNKYQ